MLVVCLDTSRLDVRYTWSSIHLSRPSFLLCVMCCRQTLGPCHYKSSASLACVCECLVLVSVCMKTLEFNKKAR